MVLQNILTGYQRMREKLLYLLDFPDSWFGGVNYFSNQITYLLINSDTEVVIASYDELTDKIYKQVSDNIKDKNILEERFHYVNNPNLKPSDKASKFIKIILRIKNKIQKEIIQDVKPDVILHMGGLSGVYSNITQVGWIPDMQHIELPANFSLFNRLKRTLGYFFLSLNSDKIMMSSVSQENVYNRFYRNMFAKKVFVYKFRVLAKDRDESVSNEVSSLKDKKYVLFPASFWAHKNHQVLLDLIKKEGADDYCFVFTGGGVDYRNQAYSSSIQQQIDALSEEKCVHLFSNLGNSDLDYLIANAEVLVNPSFYEGWSTIVEEAKLAGIKLLISDISTHREQLAEYEHGLVFDPNSLSDLEAKFIQLDTNPPAKKDGFDYGQLISTSVKNFVSDLFPKS